MVELTMLIRHVVADHLLSEHFHAFADADLFLQLLFTGMPGRVPMAGELLHVLPSAKEAAGRSRQLSVTQACSPAAVRGIGTKPGNASMRASQARMFG